MKIRTLLGTCAAALLGFSSVGAQEKAPMPASAPKGAPAAAPVYHYQPECCDTGCGHKGGGCYAEAEATFFRYHRADGVRVDAANDDPDGAEFDFEISPRLTVGYVCGSGLGARVRWWTYDNDGKGLTAPDNFVSVDTDVTDVEVFGVIELDCNWKLDVSGGIRFVNFEEILFNSDELDTRVNSFDGWGGVVGVELRRTLGESCGVFARVRGAILMGDKDLFVDEDGDTEATTLLDSTLPMLELALGVEYRTCLWDMDLFARATAEWQHWYNFSSSFEDTFGNDDFAGNSDVGFGGFAFSVGIRR